MNVKRSTGGHGGGGRRGKIQKLEPAADEEPRSYTDKPVLDSHLFLLIHGRFTDVTFIVGERKVRIPCHQLFLKARSPVFEVMFSERWNQDAAAKEIPLEDVHPRIFQLFLLFIYTDTLKTDVSQTLELLKLAHKYDVQVLVSKCEALLESQLTLDHALEVFQAAKTYERKRLMDKVGDFWAKSLSKMQIHPSLTQLDKATLTFILQRKDLKMKEVDIFRLALQWAGNQTGADVTVEASLEDILPLIRFPTMTLHEFTTAVVPTKVLPSSKVIELFTYFGTDDEAKKSLASTLGFSTQHRQPKDLTFYTKLYAAGNRNNTTRFQRFQYLQECIQFHEASHLVATPAGAPEDHAQGIGLSGITFHCPAKGNTVTAPGNASNSSKTFKICVRSKDCGGRQYDFYSNEDYRNLLKLPSVQVTEGKTTDIKFDIVVPLKKGTIYCITIEEAVRWTATDAQGYYAKYFGPGPNELVNVKINNLVHTGLAVRRNEWQGFQESAYALPQLICRLAFQEL